MKNARLVIVIFATLAVLGSMLIVIPPVEALPIFVDSAGSGQFTTIQDAVDYWPQNGPAANPGPIIVKPGWGYNEAVYINRSKSGIKIMAQPGTVLDGLSGTLLYGFEINGTANVLIKGFIIQHYSEAGIYIHADNSVTGRLRAFRNWITNNTIKENFGMGISIGASDRNMISGNILHDNDKHAIFIDDGSNNTLKGNSVLNNKWTGIELHIAPNTEVRNNNVTGNSWNGLYADGGSPLTEITSNIIDSNDAGGIYLLSSSNTISLNTINSNGYGIMIRQGDNNVIKKNQIDGNSGIGIFLQEWLRTDTSDYNTIIDNIANNNGLYGILIGGGDYNLVERNEANLNGYIGIGVRRGFWMTVPEHNTILNNTANGNGGGGRGYGIMIAGGDLNMVEVNQANSNVDHGIYIVSAYSNTVGNNEFGGNGETGIFMEIASNNKIRSNYVHDNSQDGIFMTRSSSSNEFVANDIYYNGWSGMEFRSTSTEAQANSQLVENEIVGNGLWGLIADHYSYSSTIVGNTVMYNYYDGICVESDSNIINSNKVTYNNLDGIRVEWGEYNTINYNEASYNGHFGIVMGSLYTGNACYNNDVRYNLALNNTMGNLAESPITIGTNTNDWSGSIQGPVVPGA